jgi:transposase
MTSKLKRSKRKSTKKVLHEARANAAGIDIGAYEVFVAVPDDRDEESIRSFSTFTEDLQEMARWLKQCRIDTVAMESTGVYWIPVFQILEAFEIEVYLVNARHVKNVPGRKTDVLDCQWLQYLHSVGLLSASFRPSADVVAVRTLLRHRENLIKYAASHIQHIQKSLTQMNLYLHNVISNITGVTGLAIIDAILSGEHEPATLAKLRDHRIKADEDTIAKSLVGDYKEEHLFTLRQAVDLYRYYKTLVQECDHEIELRLMTFETKREDDPTGAPMKRSGPNELAFDVQSYLYRIYGVDLTQVPGISGSTAHTFFTEIGSDIYKFKTVHHFTSWLGLSPKNKISGGKVLSSKTSFSSNRVAKALRLAANALYNSRSYLGGYFRKMRSRLGAPKAITATAHKLARIVYSMLTNQTAYDESVFAVEEAKYKARLMKRLKKQAAAFGLSLVAVQAGSQTQMPESA